MQVLHINAYTHIRIFTYSHAGWTHVKVLTCVTFLDTGGPYFAWNWNMVLYACLAVTTIFTFIGWLSKHTSLVESSQGMSVRNVFLLTSHITFAVLFTAQVFPYTYCGFHFYFTTYGLNDWTISWSISIMIFGVSLRLILYVIQGSIRGVICPFIFITAHHMGCSLCLSSPALSLAAFLHSRL